MSAKNRVKSRSFFRVFPSREIRVARTSHRARTHGTNVAHGACEASHAAEPSTSRGRETRTHTRAAHLAPVFGESPDNGSRPRTSSHAMPAVSKAGAGAPKRAAAAPAIVEDPSTLVPCPVITAHPNGFVERTEPERETHEVRCVLPTRSSVFPTTAHRAARTRARRAARPARRIAPRAEKIRRAASPSTRARAARRARADTPRAPTARPRTLPTAPFLQHAALFGSARAWPKTTPPRTEYPYGKKPKTDGPFHATENLPRAARTNSARRSVRTTRWS